MLLDLMHYLWGIMADIKMKYDESAFSVEFINAFTKAFQAYNNIPSIRSLLGLVLQSGSITIRLSASSGAFQKPLWNAHTREIGIDSSNLVSIFEDITYTLMTIRNMPDPLIFAYHFMEEACQYFPEKFNLFADAVGSKKEALIKYHPAMSKIAFQFNNLSHVKKKQFIGALSILMNVPAFNDLFQHAVEHKPISIAFVSEKEVPFGAKYIIEDNKIYLNENLKMLYMIINFIFELSNAANPERHNLQYSRFDSADDYANAMEFAEYNTTRKQQETLIAVASDERFKDLVSVILPQTVHSVDFVASKIIEGAELTLQCTFEKYLQNNKKAPAHGKLSHYDNYKKEYEEFKLMNKGLSYIIALARAPKQYEQSGSIPMSSSSLPSKPSTSQSFTPRR